LIKVSGRGKAGYNKIKFCGEQAAKDGLQHFWIDSCCIKKSSDAELSESINSMFRWYKGAAECYVYLSDVSTCKRKKRDQNLQYTWELAFQGSRWFTRGWTLQELLAPASVGFFSREHTRLGDKKSLEQQIHEITGIPVSALQGRRLSEFTIDERMFWAAKRETKREEDKVYSLLGLFDIHMPLIYGEGVKDARRRLLKEIHEASRGTHNPIYHLHYRQGER
jgi:Heterokaryon incompatibility protein (HET)